MLTSKFNKVGDTSFRVASQISSYYQVYLWINEMEIELQTNKNHLNLNEWNDKFIQWTKNEGVYNYRQTLKIKNRFLFIKATLIDKMKIMEYKDGHFISKYSIKNFNDFTEFIFNNLYFEFKNDNGGMPFKETIDYVNSLSIDELSNLELPGVIVAFQVYENINDDFNYIVKNYTDVISKIIDHEYQRLVESKNNFSFEVFGFKKTTDEVRLKWQKIIDIYEEKKFNDDDLKIIYSLYRDKKYLTIKKIFNNIIKKLDYPDLTNGEKILEYIKTTSIKNFIFETISYRINDLLLSEYYDLFRRYLNDFGLLNNNKLVKEFIFKDEKILLSKFSTEIEYPFSVEFVNHALDEISNNIFSFKDKQKYLKNIANSTLAEYFVNLKFAYWKKIPPNQFCNYSRTIVSKELMPIFTAPGRGADLEYVNIESREAITVETTIHNTPMLAFTKEIEPLIRHAKSLFDKYENFDKKIIYVSPISYKTNNVEMSKMLSIINTFSSDIYKGHKEKISEIERSVFMYDFYEFNNYVV